MKSGLTLDQRIEGCLVGAAIGAELGFARCMAPDKFAVKTAKDVWKLKPEPLKNWKPTPHRTDVGPTRLLVDLGVRSYVKAGGRVTPEVFGDLFKNDPGVAFPAFWWDGLHTVQEILKEGMNPRVSGIGTYPNGFIGAAMPAVGIYHFAHPDYAYIDGVELASVAQARLGADWAGLSAATVAAAFTPDATGASVSDTVMKIAFQNNRELFYQMESVMRWFNWKGEAPALNAWIQRGAVPESFPDSVWASPKDVNWIAYNPVLMFLPVIKRYGDSPMKCMQALLAAPTYWYNTSVAAIMAGAALGAMHGAAAFPKAWRKWATPIAEPWGKLAGVVKKRLKTEATIIRHTEQLAAKDHTGGSVLKEKVTGCILAGAIGNAMGSPVEGRMYWEIDEKYPKAITTVLDPSRLEGEDDNQMAMLLVETYLGREGMPVMARHFGKTWLEKLNRLHFFMFCMGHSYDLIGKGWDARITGHWGVVTGSTVMCMEPVGVYHMMDPEFAAIDGLAISYMYQRGLDAIAASMLSATVAEAFRPGATVDSVCQAGLAAAPKSKMLTFDKRPFRSCHDYIETCLEIADKYTDVLKVRKELYDKCLLYHMIDPLELWGFSLAMFKIAKGDVRQAAIGGTNIGRDSDTISGRAAMLSGILSGAGNVPKEWVAMFKPETLDRINRNASRLADLIANRKVPILRARQSIAS